MKDQLTRTQAVVQHALQEHGFDLVVVVTVTLPEPGELHFECALDGEVPPYASAHIAGALREIANRVERGMNLQTEAYLARGVS